jgi:hypothetical protein
MAAGWAAAHQNNYAKKRWAEALPQIDLCSALAIGCCFCRSGLARE